MKNDEKLLEAMNYVDGKYVEEAENAPKAEKKHRSFSFGLTAWQKGLVAACVAIVVMVGILTIPSMKNPVIAEEPTATVTPIPLPTPYDAKSPAKVNIYLDYAEDGVKYLYQDKYELDYYGKYGYQYIEENGNPEFLPEAISPKEFNDLSALRNAVLANDNMSDYRFVCQDGTEYHIMVNYKAWNIYQLDNDDKAIDWYNKANKALADNMKSTFNYDAKLPEAIEYDPEIFSEDLNDCYIGSTELVLDGGNLVYSYVEGKLSCIWFYAYDTVFEIYSDVKQDWIHSLDGWLSDLASLETAPRAAERLRSIAKASWDVALQNIYDNIEAYANGDMFASFPSDWYMRDKEKYPDDFYKGLRKK